MPEINEPVEPAVETVVDEAADVATDAAKAAAGEDDAELLDSIQDRLIDTVTATQQEAIDTIESASQAMLEMFSIARVEITDFVAERIRQDLDVQQAFLRCRSLDEVRDVQVQFVRTALDQYGGEAAKLMRLGGEVATRTLERARV
jgi:Phasin protein